MNYIDELNEIIRKYLGKGQYAGCGMYNFDLRLDKPLLTDNKCDRDIILQSYPIKENDYYGECYILYHRKNEDDCLNIHFDNLCEKDKEYILNLTKTQIGDCEKSYTYEVCPYCGSVSQERKNKHFELLGELVSATDEIYNIEGNIYKGGTFNNKYTTKEGVTIEDFFIGEDDIYFNDGKSDRSYTIGTDIFAEDAQFLLEEILMEHYTEIE